MFDLMAKPPKKTDDVRRGSTIGIEPAVERALQQYCQKLAASDPTRKSSMRFIASQAIREFMERNPLPPAH